MENPEVIIVGAGPAGSAAAIKLAQEGVKTVLIERGMPVGSKNLSGGVMWGRDLDDILPEWEEEAPVERYIINKKVGILSDEDATVIDLHFDEWNRNPRAGWSVLRAPFDEWLAIKAEEAGAAVLSGIKIDSLIFEEDAVVGVKQGDEELCAPIVILAEGSNARLMLNHGLHNDRTRFEPYEMMIGIKEVMTLDREIMEERFMLEKNQGTAGEFIMGNVPDGVKAGGFFYTNKDTLSVGVVVHLDSLSAHKDNPEDMKSYKIIEYFKNHPLISRMLKDSKSVEYGAKIIPEYSFKNFPKHYGKGYMVVGDAGGFTFSNGIVIQGINYAIRSGILAAETIIEAKQKGELVNANLKVYEKKLAKSYIYKDFKRFQKVKKMTKNPDLFEKVPIAINNGFKELLTENGEPKKHVLKTILGSFKETGLGFFRLVGLGLKARHL